jgi:hypothetical protein
VTFEIPVFARGLTVYETHNTGFVTQIDLIDTSSGYHTIWTGTDNTGCPGEFMLTFAKTSYKVSGMKIYTQQSGWEEIDAVKLLGDSDLAPGTLSEHAIAATASSEFDVAGWSAMQAAGFPDTPSCDDVATAWAPESTSSDSEWLETSFRLPLYATGVTVYETHNAGFVTQIDLIDVNGNYNTIWTGSDSTTCPGEFSITFSQTEYKVEGVRIHSAKSGWEEIDAVKLTGQFTGL